MSENMFPATVHLGTQSEVTGMSAEPMAAKSEITDITFASDTRLARSRQQSRFELYDTSKSPSQPSPSTVTNANPVSYGSPSRWGLLCELLRLNCRMLISSTLTLFIAMIVSDIYFYLTNRSQWIHFFSERRSTMCKAPKGFWSGCRVYRQWEIQRRLVLHWPSNSFR